MIKFTTNIDAYNSSLFSVIEDSMYLPRVGDLIEIDPEYHSTYRSKKLPIRLEVVSVTRTIEKK